MYYRIAGHIIRVNTPDRAKTIEVLPNFEPFRIGEESGMSGEVLFEFTGNSELRLPEKKADDGFVWNGIHYEVYKNPDFWTISMKWNGHTHLLEAASDWKTIRTDISLTDISKRMFLNNFLIVSFGMAAAPLHTLKMHASVIEKDGEALLFLGKSGTGKSTHSRLWLEFVDGASLLNDDEPIVRINEEGEVRVYGSPWSGKTPCYRNAAACVKGFVHLYQSPENKLSPLSGRDALASLFVSSCMMRTDEDNKNCVFDTIADILQTVSVYRLDCRPDREAVLLTRSLMQ